MIVIGDKIFVVVPLDDACARAMRGDRWPMVKSFDKAGKLIGEAPENGGDPEHVELMYWDTKKVLTKQPSGFEKLPLSVRLSRITAKTGWWRVGLKMAESMYGSKAQWVCPD